MTRDELARHDGRDGRRAYIAVGGTVYDVTDSPRWQNGLHPPDHQAGMDLTDELKSAPHVRAVVERFPVVGTLEETTAGESSETNGSLKVTLVLAALIGIALLVFLFK
ncbi:MAG: cytochrome b5 domain-containing protein [Desulfuromonadales bacterium]|nr:cytochrome b5 domain-containing protein [Desulfuromonadales bacterium]